MTRSKPLILLLVATACVGAGLGAWAWLRGHRPQGQVLAVPASPSAAPAQAANGKPLVERVPPYPYFQNWAKRIAPDDPFERIHLDGMLGRLGYEEVTSTEELRSLLYQVKGRDEGKAMYWLSGVASAGEESERAKARAKELGYPDAMEPGDSVITDSDEFKAMKRRVWARRLELARAGDSEAMMRAAQAANALAPEVPSTAEEKTEVYWLQKAVNLGRFDAPYQLASALAAGDRTKWKANLSSFAEGGDYMAAWKLFEIAVNEGNEAEQAKWDAKIVALTGSRKTMDDFLGSREESHDQEEGDSKASRSEKAPKGAGKKTR